MAQYIDKDTLVDEIKRRRKLVSDPILSGDDLMIGERNALFDMLSFIDTIEVKEVDLDKEIEKCLKQHNMLAVGKKDFTDISKHFFELGLQVQFDEELVEEIYSHINSVKDTADRMTSGNFMNHKAAIKFSANTIAKVLELMGLKAQKGE